MSVRGGGGGREGGGAALEAYIHGRTCVGGLTWEEKAWLHEAKRRGRGAGAAELRVPNLCRMCGEQGMS